MKKITTRVLELRPPIKPRDMSSLYAEGGMNWAICRRKYLRDMRHYENDLREYRRLKAKEGN